MTCMHFSHINQAWAHLIIHALEQIGVEDICIAPGSRSTPLTLAAANSALLCHQHFDERGLAFMALGMAKASKKPVAILTTSGTAVANLYPAVIEASLTQVPLIVLSADRPTELIDCGANQAIEQQGIFANYPLYHANLDAPNNMEQLPCLLATLKQVMAYCRQGPTHLNCMFAEPLYPSSTALEHGSPQLDFSTEIKKAKTELDQYCSKAKPVIQSEDLSPLYQQKKGIIVAGTISCPQQAQLVAQFAEQLNWPLFADIQSQLAGSKQALTYYDLLLKRHEFIELLSQAESIIQFGARLLSKRLLKFIENFKGQYWQIDPAPCKLDPLHKAQRFYTAHEHWLQQQKLNSAIHPSWLHEIQSHNQAMETLITKQLADKQLNELNLARHLPALLAEGSTLFIGNSMPVRCLDMLHPAIEHSLHYMSNRGASGIDGLLATAVGVALAKAPQRVTLLIGDISLLHDLNSLALCQQVNNLNIILVNNDGGSIFNFLPVPKKWQQKFYQLPHQTQFSASAAQFKLPHQQVTQLDELKEAIEEGNRSNITSLIELKVPNDEAQKLLRQIDAAIHTLTL